MGTYLSCLHVTMSRVTCLILQDHTAICFSHCMLTQEKLGRGFGEKKRKKKVNGRRRKRLARKKSLAVGEARMAIF